jgi:hypothetical protein
VKTYTKGSVSIKHAGPPLTVTLQIEAPLEVLKAVRNVLGRWTGADASYEFYHVLGDLLTDLEEEGRRVR